MMRAVLLFAPLLGFALPFAMGCNTAQISQPPLTDAGPVCETIPPVFTCEAGVPSPTSCSGGVTLSPVVGDGVDASFVVPVGSYADNCTVQIKVSAPGETGCLPTHPCVCADDAGVQEDGAAAPPGWFCDR